MNKGRRVHLVLGHFLVGVAIFYLGGFYRGPIHNPLPDKGHYLLIAEVKKQEETSQGPRSIIRVVAGRSLLDKKKLPADARLYLFGKPPPLGATVLLFATIKPWTDYNNPSPHPKWPWANVSSARAGAWRLEHSPTQIIKRQPIFERIQSIRNGIRIALARHLDASSSGLAQAWILGEAKNLDDDFKDQLRLSGLAHVLAVSGLHISLLCAFLLSLLKTILRFAPVVPAHIDRHRMACLLVLPLTLLIALIANGTPSAWRAALTAFLSWGAAGAGRRPKASRIMAGAILFFCHIDPGQALSPAFLLSVAATTSLLSVRSPRYWTRQWKSALRTFVATAPIVVWCFGNLPAVSILSNVFLLPFISAFLIPLCFAHLFAAVVAPPLAPITAALFAFGKQILEVLCEKLATIPLGHALPPLSLAQGIVFAISVLWWLASHTNRQRLVVTIVCIGALSIAEWHLRVEQNPRDELRVTFVDIGQGDAAIIDLPNGKTMLIDTGGDPLGHADPTGRALVPLLRARRKRTIDVIAISHPHPDHYGGLKTLLDGFEVREIWDSGQARAENPRGSYAGLLTYAQQRGAHLRYPDELCDKARIFGSATVETLWPCPAFDFTKEVNDNSLVLRVSFGKQRYLFTGDIEEEAESELTHGGKDLTATVLKVAHHGSRSSSNPNFIKAVSPHVAVISCGRDNSFGHPHQETLTTLRSEGIEVWQTQKQGGLIVSTHNPQPSARLLWLDYFFKDTIGFINLGTHRFNRQVN